MTNELLEFYGDLFVSFKMEKLLYITFEQFLTQPNFFTDFAYMLDCGDGLNICEGVTRMVELTA